MKWLDRTLVTGPYLYLALNAPEYHRALDRLKVGREGRDSWISPRALATVHSYDNPDGGLACVVCVDPTKYRTPIGLARRNRFTPW